MGRKLLAIFFIAFFFFTVGGLAAYFILTPSTTEVTKQVSQPKETTNQSEETTLPPKEPTTTELVDTSDWKIYEDKEHNFRLKYPPEGQLVYHRENEARINFPVEPGTLLIEKYLLIITEELAPGEKPINPLAPLIEHSETVEIHGIKFTKEVGSEPAAGSVYEFTDYSTVRGNTLIRLRFVLHSTNPGAYDVPPLPFDKEKEMGLIDLIITTFRFMGGEEEI